MASTTASPPAQKRKRDPTEEELAIDLSLPEPLSKKALRKAKRSKSTPTTTTAEYGETSTTAPAESSKSTPNTPAARSDHAIWIGNLPWTATKADIRSFFTKDDSIIKDEDITRVHMPAPPTKNKDKSAHPSVQPKNKGFAYVDFATEMALTVAMRLSESFLAGRKVLIKNAKSFEGRPDVSNADKEAAKVSGKAPSKRVFVGNLGFDVGKEDLERHFGRCGEVEGIHVATFEDSGKCKGYAWVTFETIEAASAAVKGWVDVTNGVKEESDEDSDAEQQPKKRRIWVNKIEGRKLRCEFAEDPTVRYHKRFGKGKRDGETTEAGDDAAPIKEQVTSQAVSTAHDRRREKRRKENLVPSTIATVGAAGKKITLD